jgi:MATE family multidrug resistance protein
MVAKLGHEELAAVGISNSIFFLLAIFPMGVTMAFSAITGMLHGNKKTSLYHYFVKDSFISTIILSVFISVIISLIIRNFEWINQPENVTQISKPYFTLLNWSLMPMLIFLFAKNVSDGFSYTKGGMFVTISALCLNIFLNWVLIYGNLGFNAYGVNGAGYATIISRVYMGISMFIILFRSSNTPLQFSEFITSLSRSSRINFFRKIIRLGFPSGLQYFFEVAAFAGAAVMAGWLGAKELAAHQLAITIASFTYMFAGGIAAGGSICVAKSFGNKNLNHVKKYGEASWQIGFIVMSFFAIIFLLFNHSLAQLFSDKEEIIKMGAHLLVIAAIFQLSDGIQAISVALLRGITDVKLPSFFIFIAYWIIAIPLGYVLSKSTQYDHWSAGLNGIWIALSVGLTISAAVLSYRFYYLLRRS